jgi:hypothetical protein
VKLGELVGRVSHCALNDGLLVLAVALIHTVAVAVAVAVKLAPSDENQWPVAYYPFSHRQVFASEKP